MSASVSIDAAMPARRPRTRHAWNRLAGVARRSPTMAIGAGIILFFAALALFHLWVMPHDPVRAYPTEVLKPPSARFWFGTDGNGMDVFSRVIYGSLYAFGIAGPSVAIGLLLGVPLGLWTGYRGGTFDEVVMRVFDALRVFPIIILALAIVAATGQSLVNVIFVIGLTRRSSCASCAPRCSRCAPATSSRPPRPSVFIGECGVESVGTQQVQVTR